MLQLPAVFYFTNWQKINSQRIKRKNQLEISDLNQKTNIRIAFGIVLFSLLFAILVGAGMVSLLKVFFPNLGSTNISLITMLISTLLICVPVIVYLHFTGLSIRKRLRINSISKYSLFSIIFISIGFIVIIDELDRIVYILFGQPEFLQELVEQLQITSIKLKK